MGCVTCRTRDCKFPCLMKCVILTRDGSETSYVAWRTWGCEFACEIKLVILTRDESETSCVAWGTRGCKFACQINCVILRVMGVKLRVSHVELCIVNLRVT